MTLLFLSFFSVIVTAFERNLIFSGPVLPSLDSRAICAFRLLSVLLTLLGSPSPGNNKHMYIAMVKVDGQLLKVPLYHHLLYAECNPSNCIGRLLSLEMNQCIFGREVGVWCRAEPSRANTRVHKMTGDNVLPNLLLLL